MSESIIKISKEYKDFSGSIWLGREVPIIEGVDDPIAAFQKAEQEMDSYYHSRGKAPLTDFNTGQPEAPIDPNAALRLQQLINGATTTEELETYYPDAEKYGLTGTWDKRLKELKSKTTP